MYKKEKSGTVSIIQISSASYANMYGGMNVFGLGDDGLVYIWNEHKVGWFLYQYVRD